MMMEGFIELLDNYLLPFVWGVLLSSAIVAGLCARYRHYPELDKVSKNDVWDDDRAYNGVLCWVGVSSILLGTILFVLSIYGARKFDIHQFRLLYAISVYASLMMTGIIAILESYGYVSFNSCRTSLLLSMAWMTFYDDTVPAEATGFVIRSFHVHVLALWINLYYMKNSNATTWVANAVTFVGGLPPLGWNIALGIPTFVNAMTRLYCDYGILCFTFGATFVVTCMDYKAEDSTETNEKEQVNRKIDLNDMEQPLLPDENEVIMIGVGVMMDD